MIGVLGGTFDPIHAGHLRAALEVQQALGLSEMRLVPLAAAVHRGQPVASASQRLAMLEAAVADEPTLIADDRELARSGPSFTVDTLESLRAEIGPERPLCFVVGSDAFSGFPDWRRPIDILRLAHLIVTQRPGAPTARDPWLRDQVSARRVDRPDLLRQAAAGHIYFQTITQLDISATRIRRLLARNLSPRYLLPDSVLALAREAGCYAQCDDAERRQ